MKKEEWIETMKERQKDIMKMKYAIREEMVETNLPTKLHERAIEKQEVMAKEILQMARENKITEVAEFDKKYPIFQLGLEKWIAEYVDQVDPFCQANIQYVRKEMDFLEEVLDQFKVEESLKQEYELLVIRDQYELEKKQEAKNELEKWIKKYPKESLGYELKCNWELRKKHPDMEEIAKIIRQANDNRTWIQNEEIYNNVIGFYDTKGEEEIAEYYQSMIDLKTKYKYSEFETNQKVRIVEEIKEVATDKVRREKTYEEYIKDDVKKNLLSFLAVGLLMQEEETIKIIQEIKEIEPVLKEQQEEILKVILEYLPEDRITLLKKMNPAGYIEINMDGTEKITDLHQYYSLRAIWNCFLEVSKRKTNSSYSSN